VRRSARSGGGVQGSEEECKESEEECKESEGSARRGGGVQEVRRSRSEEMQGE